MAKREILLVEDDPDDEEMALRALKDSGVEAEVSVVRDGAQALDYLLAQGPYADRGAAAPLVVLLDLNLPKVDGFEVLRRLRAEERTRRVPVVVFSTSKESRDIARSYELGANSYVHKPVEFPRFAEALVVVGRYWTVWNEAPPPAAA